MAALPPIPGPALVRELKEVALGRRPAQVLIRGARVVNVFSGEVQPPQAVALYGGRVASLGPELPGWVGEETQVVQAQGLFLMPGLIDAHTHLDAGYSPGEFSARALAGGNTSVVTECAMIAGAAGARGVAAFLADAKAQPLRWFFLAPPLVPPFPRLEGSAGLGLEEFRRLLEDPRCRGCGEVYWTSLLDSVEGIDQRLAATLAAGKQVEGHSAGARGERLAAYAAAGVGSCHESTTAGEALERLRLGFAVQVRQGMVRQEMDQVVPALAGLDDTSQVMLVSDSASLEQLMDQGPLLPLLIRAVELGVAPARAVAWLSLNPARHFGLTGLGAVAPGWVADLVLVEDLSRFRVRSVFLEGKEVVRQGRLLVETPPPRHLAELGPCLHCRPLTAEALQIPAPARRVAVRVVELANHTITREGRAELDCPGGFVASDPGRDLLKLMHLNRQSPQARPALGLVRGFGLRRGAVATTLQWDNCNLVALGAGDREICLAANRVLELGGGVVVAAGDEVLAEMPLPLAGIFSPRPMEELAVQERELAGALAGLGCGLENPLLALQTLCFTGLPFLRLTDRGLVDMRRRRELELFL